MDLLTVRVTDRQTLDWLIKRLTDQLTYWLKDWNWLADWLTDWLSDWPTDWLMYWLIDWNWQADWLTDGHRLTTDRLSDTLLTDCLTGLLSGWIDWLTHQQPTKYLAGGLVDWLTEWPTTDRLSDTLLTDWFPGWLSGWMTDWQPTEYLAGS